MDKEFFTFNEYLRKNDKLLSPSEEDYIEMIYRLSRKKGFTRVSILASALNVQPPSVTKMVQKFADIKLVKYEKYGAIRLEPLGKEIGKNLLDRHNLVEEFLELINVKKGLLETTEKLEHTINDEVFNGFKNLINFFKDNPEILVKYQTYISWHKYLKDIY